MTTKTYQGSCHCKRVRYQVDLDLAKGTGRCNCTLCTKLRAWSANVKPDAFKLLSGEDALSTYSKSEYMQYRFCRHCGVQAFGTGNIPELGGAFVSVKLGGLDDVEPAELIAAPIRFFNGRNNRWMETPAETRHL